MRKPDDTCLLCLENLANKTNSHIVPKFITKDLLKSSKGNRGFEFSSDTADKQSRMVQSSDKESFILCSDCEDYFNVLETYFSNEIHYPLIGASRDSYFEWYHEYGKRMVTVIASSGLSVRLFISSIIWRCAISNVHIAHRFNLTENSTEQLRQALLNFKASNKTDFIKLILGQSYSFPFAFEMTTIVERERTIGKLVFLHPNENDEGFMLLNDYLISYQFHPNKRLHINTEPSNGPESNQVVRIQVPRIEDWNAIIQLIMRRFVKASTSYLRRVGKPYSPMIK